MELNKIVDLLAIGQCNGRNLLTAPFPIYPAYVYQVSNTFSIYTIDSLRRSWINDCNKTVSLTKEHPRASIWSPSFPRQYPDNANCFTTITAPTGYRVVIEFEELVIENEAG